MNTYRIILSVFGIKLVRRLNHILLKTNKLWKTYCTWMLLFVNLKKNKLGCHYYIKAAFTIQLYPSDSNHTPELPA